MRVYGNDISHLVENKLETTSIVQYVVLLHEGVEES